jgi:hypothetical protein
MEIGGKDENNLPQSWILRFVIEAIEEWAR